MKSQYSLGEFIHNCVYLAYTKLRYRHARLIRLPFYLRGRRHFSYKEGLTVGYGCRFDLAGEGITLIVGANCKINDRVHIVAHEHVEIGNDVLMASDIFISDTSHGSYGSSGSSSPAVIPDERPLVTSPVKIGDRVWIGEGARILPGVTIGDGCIVGANAVVTRSFSPNTIVGGIPAKIIKRWNDELQIWERES